MHVSSGISELNINGDLFNNLKDHANLEVLKEFKNEFEELSGAF
jgi:hypothetical protein